MSTCAHPCTGSMLFITCGEQLSFNAKAQSQYEVLRQR